MPVNLKNNWLSTEEQRALDEDLFVHIEQYKSITMPLNKGANANGFDMLKRRNCISTYHYCHRIL